MLVDSLRSSSSPIQPGKARSFRPDPRRPREASPEPLVAGEGVCPATARLRLAMTVTALAGLVVLLGSAPSVGAPEAEGKVARHGVFLRINGKDIPRDRFVNELVDALGDSYRETFITHVLIMDKAMQLGLEASPMEIESHAQLTVEQVLTNNFSGDMTRMQDALKDRGMTLEGWKKRLRIDAQYDVLTEKILKKDRTVSDETLKHLFEEKYGPEGVQIKIRHILKNVTVASSQDYTLQQYEQDKPKIEQEAKARAEEALQKIRGGASFETVMAEYSDDPRKATGGALSSWKGRFGTDLDEAASKLNKSDVSEVVKGPDGFRIVQCTDVTDTEELHALHILIATGPRGKGRTDEEAKKKAEELLAKIKAGADFGQLAKDNSDDAGSGPRGGDLGFFGRKAMVKPFEDAAFALQAGQVSDIVKSNSGYHIIKLLEKRSTPERTLRQILISTQMASVKDRKLRPALEAKARGELEAALKELQASGGSFAEVAKIRSDDGTSKTEGGLIRNYRPGLYGGTFDDAVKTQKAGDPPRIVKDAAGNLHLLMVEDVVKTDLATVRSSLEKEELQRAPTPQEKTEYITRLRETATVVP